MNGEIPVYHGKLAIQQRVLPGYRGPFFDLLAGHCLGGLHIFAGAPLPEESIQTTTNLKAAHLTHAHNLHLFAPGNPLFLCAQPGILNWLQKTDPDVLILEANPRYLTNRIAINWMHRKGKPVLGWGLGISVQGTELSYSRAKARLQFLHSFDGLIAYSETGAAQYCSMGFPPEAIFVAPNAVMARPVEPPPDRPVKLDRTPVILFVGRLQKRKRIDLLIEACASLSSFIPEVRIVGDGPEKKNLEHFASQHFPQTVFTGALSGDALEHEFKAADIFVLPGTGGLAVQQAMRYGLPVIAAEGDGSMDALVSSENGWIVEPGKKNSLVMALNAALMDIPHLREMGLASYQIIARKANLENMVSGFIKAITTYAKDT